LLYDEGVGEERLRLKDKHTWKAKPGNSICVLDRGLVRFDYPSNWVVEADEGAVHLHDREPGVESCDLGASIFRVPPAELASVPLDEMLLESLGTDREPYQQSEIRHIQRGNLEIAWLEQWYVENEYQRDARFRVALARGETLCLISMNYWADRAAGLERVWDEVLRSLVMGLTVKDPTAGPLVQ
jgi:hypothetical protein